MKKALFLISVFMVFVLAAGASCAQKRARIQGYDVLTLPGSKVMLWAKVEDMGALKFAMDIENITVNFTLGNASLGQAVTADNGFACIEYTAPANSPKDVNITCRCLLSPGSDYIAEDANIYIAVRDNNTQILITDIDHTIADVSSAGFLVKSNEDVQAFANSAEVLGRLSKKYTIVYLTGREEIFMTKTKAWLKLRNFPSGPAFFWDLGKKPFSSGEYKTEAIKELKKTFPNITVGMGDLVTDAKAYLDNDMRAFIIGESKPDDLPEKARFVKTWLEIENELAEESK
jgi:hypothetical protein